MDNTQGTYPSSQYPPTYPPAMPMPVDPAYPPQQSTTGPQGGYGVAPANYKPPMGQYGAQPVHYGTSTNTVVVAQPGTTIVQEAMPDNTPAIIFSCAVAWCCCFIFGIIGFVYAYKSRDSGNPEEARRKLMLSRKYCIIGLVFGIAIYVVCTIIRVAVNVAFAAS